MNGTCATCGESIARNKDGTLRAHGPRDARCPGGRLPAPKTPDEKALRYIADGRVKIGALDKAGGEIVHAVVHVRGSREEPYVVRFNGSIWACDCDARVPRCAHSIAARLITDTRPKMKLPGDDPEANEVFDTSTPMPEAELDSLLE